MFNTFHSVTANFAYGNTFEFGVRRISLPDKHVLIFLFFSFSFCIFYFVSIFYLNFLNWSIADIQHCVSFRCAEKWTSYTYTSIHSSQILSSRGSLQLRRHQPPSQLLCWQTGPHCALLPSQHLGASLWFTTLGTGTAPDRPSPGQCAETEMSAALLKE